MIHFIYRSAITGRIVTREYAEQHPSTTVRETVYSGMISGLVPNKKG
jgi:hypothetical protein